MSETAFLALFFTIGGLGVPWFVALSTWMLGFGLALRQTLALGALAAVAITMAYVVSRRIPAFKTYAGEVMTVSLCAAVSTAMFVPYLQVWTELVPDVPMLVVPVPVAILGSAGIVSTLAALAGRVARARESRRVHGRPLP